MWLELDRIRTRHPSLLIEVSLRVIIILFVCIMQMKLKPRMQLITESDIMKYMRPRKDSYIPPWLMVVIIVLVPLIILCIPYLHTKHHEDTIQAMLAWTLALSINALITESTKLLIGRPRPDYFYRCYPTGDVSSGSLCTGINRDILEGRKSFPSGHSSFAFCSMGFLSLWLCGRLRVLSSTRGNGLNVAVCAMPLLIATVAAVSRCWDNHHHWEDVLIGSLLGFLISYYCYAQYFNRLDSVMAGVSFLISEEYSNRFGDCDMNRFNEVFVLFNENIRTEKCQKI